MNKVTASDVIYTLKKGEKANVSCIIGARQTHSSPSACRVPPTDSFTSTSYAGKIRAAANRLATSPLQTSQHHMTFKQDLWSPPTTVTSPSIKSTILFLHFTAMPVVNPAHPGRIPFFSLLSFFSYFSFLKCAVKTLNLCLIWFGRM